MMLRLTNLDKVRDRIGEIARKCGASPERERRETEETSKNRFVELLDSEQLNKGKRVSEEFSGNKTAGQRDVGDLRKTIARSAEKYNIDEELIRAVIQVESGGKPDAVSVKGARGLMQLMPRTAAMLGVDDAFDPEQNIEGGVKYLSRLTDKYEGDVEKALAAYNAGPARVDSGNGANLPETARYVRNVMALYHRYREEE
ncbi:MAG: lytic transglycosylase domain-containing protein [Synergistaceae bacterium]|jgi:soluble lytic murein transglycosylase-like protein|nr:lytic transglycosylase domain-containing protein [Synergistaceae bacterium]